MEVEYNGESERMLENLAIAEGRTKQEVLDRALGIYTEHDRIHSANTLYVPTTSKPRLSWL